MNLSHQIGQEAEDQALEWFLRQGNYQLLVKNYRCKQGELDLVFEATLTDGASFGGVELVFVEVKARTAGGMTEGLETIGWRKKQRLERAIAHYLLSYSGEAKTLRLDLLAKFGDVWTHYTNLWSSR